MNKELTNEEKYTDKEYLEGIKRENPVLIKAFYKVFFPRIEKYVLSNNGNTADARDLFQEATIVLFRKTKVDTFNLTSTLYTYIYAICKNQWQNRLKKKNRESGELLPNDILEAIDIELMEKTERYSLFRSKFQLLGESCQQLLEWFFEKKKMREIAERMNFTEAYVKKRKHYCKEKLVKLIKADPQYQELRNHQNR